MTECQGRRANEYGRRIEDALVEFLDALAPDRGFRVVRQAPVGKGIYGTDLRTDVLILGHAAYPDGLAIESKWQDQGGSVDEKFPYLVANIKSSFPCPAIVVADGGGCRSMALEWLRRQVDGQKLLAVHSITEFYSWAMRKL